MKKICLTNLGCKVNQYELDGIQNSIQGEYEIVPPLSFADIYVLNTCAVTSEAEKKKQTIYFKNTQTK